MAAISSLANIDMPVTFLLYDFDTKLILEFQKSFGKYQPLRPKNP